MMRMRIRIAAIMIAAASMIGIVYGRMDALAEDSAWDMFRTEYEQALSSDKYGDTRTIRLKGDLLITESLVFAETKGKLLIDAGSYEIRVGSKGSLHMSNSNLTIQASGGNRPVLTLDGGTMVLEKGVVKAVGRPALLLEQGGFRLQASSNGFEIQCSSKSGSYSHVITSKLSSPLTFRGLSLMAEGGISGIQTKGPLRLEWCHINVKQDGSQAPVSSQEGTVTSSASTITPSQGGGGIVVEEKDKITGAVKPDPCFLTGITELTQAVAALPNQVTVTVETPSGNKEFRQIDVLWNTKPLPVTLYSGNAYVLEGSFTQNSLMKAEVQNPSSHKASLNVIVPKQSAMETLEGTGTLKSNDTVALDLWFPCPDTPAEIYLEYTLDQQNWKIYYKTVQGENGKEERIENLWQLITGDKNGKIDPAVIRTDGKIQLTDVSLDISQAQAAQGFYVRLRVEGSVYGGISNICRFQLKSSNGQGGKTFSMISDSGGSGQEGVGEQSGQTRQTQSSAGESEQDSGSQEQGENHRGGKGSGSGGDGPTQPENGDSPKPPGPEDSDNGQNDSGKGYQTSSYGRGFRGGGGSGSMTDPEVPRKLPKTVVGAIVVMILGSIYILYRKWLKKYM